MKMKIEDFASRLAWNLLYRFRICPGDPTVIVYRNEIMKSVRKEFERYDLTQEISLKDDYAYSEVLGRMSSWIREKCEGYVALTVDDCRLLIETAIKLCIIEVLIELKVLSKKEGTEIARFPLSVVALTFAVQELPPLNVVYLGRR